MINPNCFALMKRNKCAALALEKCESEHCSFQKTQEQIDLERQQSAQRILSLEDEKRKRILKKYGRKVTEGAA